MASSHDPRFTRWSTQESCVHPSRRFRAGRPTEGYYPHANSGNRHRLLVLVSAPRHMTLISKNVLEHGCVGSASQRLACIPQWFTPQGCAASVLGHMSCCQSAQHNNLRRDCGDYSNPGQLHVAAVLHRPARPAQSAVTTIPRCTRPPTFVHLHLPRDDWLALGSR